NRSDYLVKINPVAAPNSGSCRNCRGETDTGGKVILLSVKYTLSTGNKVAESAQTAKTNAHKLLAERALDLLVGFLRGRIKLVSQAHAEGKFRAYANFILREEVIFRIGEAYFCVPSGGGNRLEETAGRPGRRKRLR